MNNTVKHLTAILGAALAAALLTAADGQQALDKATRELPDLVVCDVMMPVMDGMAFCKALKEQLATSHIPVILLTAKSLDEQRAEGYDSGADAYISKPFSEKVLLSRIGNLLKSRAQLKEHYLETGEHTVAEIAYEVGFSSPSYFSKCYRELFGSLPTENR